ncbi:MAG: hypothetical protein ACXAC5_04085 [Promethearchaeota archaeon]
MRGIRVTTRSGRRTVNMCPKCYEMETDGVELAIELDLIQKPVVVNDINQCEMHCQEKKNEPAPVRKRRHPRRGSPYGRARRRPRRGS